MDRLGYQRYVAQGGDWGDAISEQMALQKPTGLLGIHTNMPGTLPDNISAALAGGPVPTDLSGDENVPWDQLEFFYKHRVGYAQEMGIRPQTLYALEDSPIGLAAWMLDHDPASQKLIGRVFDGQSEGLTRDDILDNITLYWLTETAVSSGRLFWESKLAFFSPEGRCHSGRGERLSRRDLYGAAQLDREGLSEPDPLQSPAQGRAFCGLGTAGTLQRRAQGGVPIAPLAMVVRSKSGSLVVRPF